MENWDPGEVFVKGRYISPDTWYDGDGKELTPQVHYYVGGMTKLYGAALYRLRPQDFGELRHVDGISPAWPLGYDDFEPWYTRAEWLYQVHGNVGEDPTEGHHSRPYPWPGLSHEPRIQQIADSLAGAGYQPFHAPCGILYDEADRARSTCIRCTWCDGYPCLVHAKADAETIAVRPVLDLPNVTLLVGAQVTKLLTDSGGRRVSEVVVTRNGAEERYEGDIVVVSAGAANTAKLLLMSADDDHPNGLANGSDQVGRNYVYHNSKAVVALGEESNETLYQKTLGINDFYLGTKDYDWPIGNIQMVGKSNAEAMKGEEPHLTLLAPHFSLAEVARHAVDFWLTTEDLPLPDNRVTVDQDGHIHLAYRSSNDEEADRLYQELKTILNHSRPGPSPRAAQELLHGHGDRHRRRRPPGRHLPLRPRSGDVRPRRRLQGARARQPLRGRHELLPQHRRREPGAHRHGQRHPSRRAPRRPTLVADSPSPTRTSHPRTATEYSQDDPPRKGRHRHGRQQRHRQRHRVGAGRAGANIVIDYVSNPQATEDLSSKSSPLGDQAIGVDADVSKVANSQRLVDTAVSTFGRVDIMVNNAGIEHVSPYSTPPTAVRQSARHQS